MPLCVCNSNTKQDFDSPELIVSTAFSVPRQQSIKGTIDLGLKNILFFQNRVELQKKDEDLHSGLCHS